MEPNILIWTAPAENTDGTAIDYPLDYELGIQQPDGSFNPISVFPGTLNTDGRFYASFNDFALEPGSYDVALRAINRNRPTLMSEWSNIVAKIVPNFLPNPPFDVQLISSSELG